MSDEILKGLPPGGGYSLDAQMPTVTVANIGGGAWEMRVYDGHPSHCTSATYAVFVTLSGSVVERHASGVMQPFAIVQLPVAGSIGVGQHRCSPGSCDSGWPSPYGAG